MLAIDSRECSASSVTDHPRPARDSETFVSLPGGDSRLRAQQARIESRLAELVRMDDLKRELAATRLDDDATATGDLDVDESMPQGVTIKSEVDDATESNTMQDVVVGSPPTAQADEANSPQTKRRIAARLSVRTFLSRRAHSFHTDPIV